MALLRKEIAIAFDLTHQHICAYRDIGEDPEFGVYLIQSYGGPSLDKLIEEYGVFDLATALEITSCVASALDYAHRRNVMHQDVKPSNILIDGDDAAREVRLTDFGISIRGRVTQRTDGKGTIIATSIIGLSPGYAAPEQYMGVPRRASDQYSLGLVLCSLLEGEVFKQRYQPRSFSRLSAAQNRALAKALAFDPDRRFDSCGEFVRVMGGGR